jgi:hypothetical protein
MKNAIKYGLFIGILSGIWLLVMHFAGVYTQNPPARNMSWMEYASVIIPFTGLYLGIKNFRDNINGGQMEFFEGLFEGFMILGVGALITSFIGIIYIQNVPSILQTDYMGRIGGAGIVGILFDLIVSLLLMNKHHEL